MPSDPRADADEAADALKRLGDLLISHFSDSQEIGRKTQEDSLVDLDLIAAKFIHEQFSERFPNTIIWTEEDELERPSAPPGGFVWYIDPLDGSNNVGLGIPLFGAIAVRQTSGGVPDIAIATSPVANSIVVAIRGLGVQVTGDRGLNGVRSSLSDSVLSWVQGYGLKGSAVTETLWLDLRMACRRVLNTWSPAVDLNLLAAHRVSGLVGIGIEEPEISACELIGRESGATVLRTALRQSSSGQGVEGIVIGYPQVASELESLFQNSVASAGFSMT